MDKTAAAFAAFADLAKRPTAESTQRPAEPKRPLSAQVSERMWRQEVAAARR